MTRSFSARVKSAIYFALSSSGGATDPSRSLKVYLTVYEQGNARISQHDIAGSGVQIPSKPRPNVRLSALTPRHHSHSNASSIWSALIPTLIHFRNEIRSIRSHSGNSIVPFLDSVNGSLPSSCPTPDPCPSQRPKTYVILQINAPHLPAARALQIETSDF